jgi:hypothetical protein
MASAGLNKYLRKEAEDGSWKEGLTFTIEHWRFHECAEAHSINASVSLRIDTNSDGERYRLVEPIVKLQSNQTESVD